MNEWVSNQAVIEAPEDPADPEVLVFGIEGRVTTQPGARIGLITHWVVCRLAIAQEVLSRHLLKEAQLEDDAKLLRVPLVVSTDEDEEVPSRIAYCPFLKGVVGEGDSTRDAIESFKSSLLTALATYSELGRRVPWLDEARFFEGDDASRIQWITVSPSSRA